MSLEFNCVQCGVVFLATPTPIPGTGGVLGYFRFCEDCRAGPPPATTEVRLQLCEIWALEDELASLVQPSQYREQVTEELRRANARLRELTGDEDE